MQPKRLRIYITTAEEPLVVNGFIREIVKAKSPQIAGIGLIKKKSPIPEVSRARRKGDGRGSLMVLQAVRNALSLVLIFGIADSLKNMLRVLYFHFSVLVNRILPFFPTGSIRDIAREHNVPVREFSGINDRALVDFLRDLRPDIIINQAPGIVGRGLLETASIGVLNRHNALLPKNRGLFSPFWALYNQEEHTGVTIHFVVKELDAGKIVVQKRIRISRGETVSSLVRKCYSIAPSAMIEAIERLETGDYELLPNRDEEATYNTIPTLEQVIELWRRRWRLKRSRAMVAR